MSDEGVRHKRESSRAVAALGACAALLALLAVAPAGCGDRTTGDRGRVALIGLDGATLRVIGPLLREGRLPNLGAIARDGIAGPLRSHKSLSSPRIWNSIATGMSPRTHGITNFAYKQDGKRHLFSSTDRKVPALWNIASEAGLSVAVVNFWNTYPPERVNGVMVSDHVLAREVRGRARMAKAIAPESGGSVVYPEEWQMRLSEVMSEGSEPLTSLPNPFEGNTELPPWVETSMYLRRYAEDGALARIALAVERETRPDLLMVLLPGIDRISHHLWGVMEPPELYPPRLHPTDSQRAAGVMAIQLYYQYADALVGKILESYGPDDLVMVVSDHGFEAGTSLKWLTGVHESEKALDGVVFARGPKVGPPGGIPGPMSVNDVTPTILAWLGLPVALDMHGRVASFLSVPDPEMIATYQGIRVERVTTAPSGVENDIVERLLQLGYLEE